MDFSRSMNPEVSVISTRSRPRSPGPDPTRHRESVSRSWPSPRLPALLHRGVDLRSSPSRNGWQGVEYDLRQVPDFFVWVRVGEWHSETDRHRLDGRFRSPGVGGLEVDDSDARIGPASRIGRIGFTFESLIFSRTLHALLCLHFSSVDNRTTIT